MAVAMSVTPVSYAYAEDSAVAGVENTESGQQTVEVTDRKIGAADAAGQPAEEVTGQEELRQRKKKRAKTERAKRRLQRSRRLSRKKRRKMPGK